MGEDLSVRQSKGRYSAVKSSKLSWAGQYKKCVQYDFKYTVEYSVVVGYLKRGAKHPVSIKETILFSLRSLAETEIASLSYIQS